MKSVVQFLGLVIRSGVAQSGMILSVQDSAAHGGS